MRNKKSKRTDYSKRIKFLAITALVCSLILTAFLIYSSSLTGTESAKQSEFVKNIVKNIFNVDETVKPQKIQFDEKKMSKTYYFTNEKVKLRISTIPSNASKDCVYSFSHEGCSVDEDGYFSYSGADYATIKVTATSVYDSSVSDEVEICVRGIAPNDEAVESIGVDWYLDNEPVSAEELNVGKRYEIRTYLTIKDEYLEKYNLEDKKLYVIGLPFDVLLNGEDSENLYLFDSIQRYITFFKECSGELEMTFKKAEGNKFFYGDGDGATPLSKTVSLCVIEDPEHIYKPSGAIKPSVGVYDAENDEYVIIVPQSDNRIEIQGIEAESGNLTECRFEYADKDSRGVADIETRITLKRNATLGVCRLNLISLYDENLSVKLKVIFEGEFPESMTIAGKETVAMFSSVKYGCNFDKKVVGDGGVKWSIVEGRELAEIKDGVLKAKDRLGKVVLRAESEEFEGLYDEITVRIMPWGDFSQFIRKIIGHFSLFAFLGVGYVTFYFIRFKKHWLAYALAPVTVFSVSVVTEIIQYYTEGRSGNAVDVTINFLGGLTGIVLVTLAVATASFIIKMLRPKTFEKMKDALNSSFNLK
ncbi:MAG: VanZ family protein [Eubacteriales bacterium]